MLNYKGQIDAVLTYLDAQILKDWTGKDALFRESTSIDRLAQIACMSKRNLQLMFQAYQGETVAAYKNRIRLEYAQQLLKDGDRTLAEIADYIGFANVNAFHNTFKKWYHETPINRQRMLRCSPEDSNEMKSIPTYRVEHVQQVPVIYLSFIGSYQQMVNSQFEDKAWNLLEDYAAQYQINTLETDYWGIAFDDTDITDEEHCRYYAAVSVDMHPPIHLPVTQEIKSMYLPEGSYAVFTFKGDYKGLPSFYDRVLGNLPFELGDTPILERYLNSPYDTPIPELITELWLPMG